MEIKYRLDLYKLLPPDPVTCEVGVAQGNFSYDIVRLWKPSKHYLVDNWGKLDGTGDGSFPQEWHNMNYHTAIWQMHNYREKVEFLKGKSNEMARHIQDNTLDLVYLDANHSYEGVKNDLNAWLYKVKTGGVIAGHDFLNPDYGVRQAVYEFTRSGNFILNVIHENKDEDAGFWFYKSH